MAPRRPRGRSGVSTGASGRRKNTSRRGTRKRARKRHLPRRGRRGLGTTNNRSAREGGLRQGTPQRHPETEPPRDPGRPLYPPGGVRGAVSGARAPLQDRFFSGSVFRRRPGPFGGSKRGGFTPARLSYPPTTPLPLGRQGQRQGPQRKLTPLVAAPQPRSCDSLMH